MAVRNVLLDGLVVVLFRERETPTGMQSVLVVRLDSIGDFILWLDSATALRGLYPPESFRLVLLGNSLWGELVKAIGLFDEYVPLERKQFLRNIRYRFNILKSLRRRAWAVAIHPTFSRETLFGDSVMRVCGAEERIGSQGDCSNQSAWVKRITNRWYTRLLPASGGPLMELERNAELIRVLGMTEFRADLPDLDILQGLPAELVGSDYFVVVPGANAPMRRWPVERFAELTKLIRKSWGLKAVICGAPGEENLGIRFKNLMFGDISDYTGRTSLADYAAIIKGAQFLVGNESSAIHIAAAVGTPAFCIAGGGHFGRFVPYRVEKETGKPIPVVIVKPMECFGCNWMCTQACISNDLWSCLERITVEDVWKKLTDFLDNLDEAHP
ncbi:MAG: glycosyltransferase family 9 protein [Deltaproteobacteria bacterium]|nr:glycosyltransferase family 9 protein [Deltaproteobacteria bacterium]